MDIEDKATSLEGIIGRKRPPAPFQFNTDTNSVKKPDRQPFYLKYKECKTYFNITSKGTTALKEIDEALKDISVDKKSGLEHKLIRDKPSPACFGTLARIVNDFEREGKFSFIIYLFI